MVWYAPSSLRSLGAINKVERDFPDTLYKLRLQMAWSCIENGVLWILNVNVFIRFSVENFNINFRMYVTYEQNSCHNTPESQTPANKHTNCLNVSILTQGPELLAGLVWLVRYTVHMHLELYTHRWYRCVSCTLTGQILPVGLSWSWGVHVSEVN